MPRIQPVNLDRRFEDLDPNTFVEHREDPSALPWLPRSEGYSWAELVQFRCAVILAEAGSGKTTEFDEQVRHAAGEAVFLVPVADLANEGVDALRRLSPGFEQWLSTGTGSARLLLDSVDTALLEKQSLRRALSKLRFDLGARWDFCNVLVSCRGSDWHPAEDLRTLDDYFPALGGDEAAHQEREYRVVRMLPLDFDRARVLAEHVLGVAEVDSFFAAIHSAQADFFLTRPLDVKMLAEIWQDEGRIPALRELLSLVVDKKLQETYDDRQRSHVPPAVLREGARALAAAQLLCRVSHVRVPGLHESPSPGMDLIPGKVLSDLSASTVSELLSCALFDVPTYGRARFHHRSVQEYLAAEWLHHRLLRGCPIDEVLSLLFADVYGLRVAIPSRAPVLGWLAGTNDAVLDEAIRHAPEVLLQWADPSSLPIQWRRNALHRFVGRPSSRFAPPLDEASLRRFAHTDLAEDVSRLLDGMLAPDVAIALLNLVRVGELRACSAAALRRAIDASLEPVVCITAGRAVAAIGAPQDLAALAAYLVDTPGLDASFVASISEALFPRQMGVEQLLSVLRRACPQPADESVGLGWYIARRVREAASSSDTVAIVLGLLDIIHELPDDSVWLVGCVLEIGADLLLRAPELVSDELFVTLYGYYESWSIRFTRSGSPRKFGDALVKRPEVRQRLFWHVVTRARAEQEGRLNRFKIRYAYMEALNLALQDVDWLLQDASTRMDPLERVFALEAIMVAGCIGSEGEHEDTRAKIEALVAQDAALQRRFDRELVRHRPTGPNPWILKNRRREAAWKLRKAKTHELDAAFIRKHLESLRQGNPPENILGHLYRLMQSVGGHNRWGVAEAEVIAGEYGAEVAQAASEGFSVCWKLYTPLLPHEREQRNSVDQRVVHGLSGLLFLSHQADAWLRLSIAEARLAARYACTEINGFPDWFVELARVHPEPVLDVLRDAIEGDYQAVPLDGVVAQDVLARIRGAPADLRARLAPYLIDLLTILPGHPTFLPQVLLAMAELPAATDRLALIARTALEKDSSYEALVAWWPTWFAFEPAEAFTYLESWVPTSSGELPLRASDGSVKENDNVAVEAVPTSPNGCPEFDVLVVLLDVTTDNIETELLARIIRMLLERVPHDADIEHRGTYSPSLRDNVQHVRDRLMEQLAARPGAAAHRALCEFVGTKAGVVADWFQHKARLRAALDSEPDRWVEKDVAMFCASFLREPRTSADLFEVALGRLRDVRRDLEGGDFSPKSAYRGKEESDLQKWLAQELKLRAGGCYRVNRESEVVDEKRTDIRLHAGPSAVVTLELKRVQEYSVRVLEEEGLEKQLVGRYMRDHSSKYGVLVLCLNENFSRKWVAPDGSSWDLDRVIEYLSERARNICTPKGPAIDLRVMSINFA